MKSLFYLLSFSLVMHRLCQCILDGIHNALKPAECCMLSIVKLQYHASKFVTLCKAELLKSVFKLYIVVVFRN